MWGTTIDLTVEASLFRWRLAGTTFPFTLPHCLFPLIDLFLGKKTTIDLVFSSDGALGLYTFMPRTVLDNMKANFNFYGCVNQSLIPYCWHLHEMVALLLAFCWLVNSVWQMLSPSPIAILVCFPGCYRERRRISLILRKPDYTLSTHYLFWAWFCFRMYLCISAGNGISHFVFGSLILLFLVSKWHGQKGFWSGGWLYFTHWPGGCDDPLLFVPDWSGSTAHQGVEQKGCGKKHPWEVYWSPVWAGWRGIASIIKANIDPGLWWGTGRLAFNVGSVWPVGT